jgi:putative PEP-CTERM system TPR-repeat lipoprotein
MLATHPRSGFFRSARKVVAVLLSSLALGACSASPDQMISSARGYIQNKDLNAAAIQLKNALQKDDQLPEGHFLLGSVYFEQENYQGASKELRRAFKLNYPKDDVVPLLARSLVNEREFDLLVRDLGTVKLDSPAAQALLETARGDALAGKKQYKEAEQAYAAALAANPKETLARIGQARVKLVKGDLAQSQADAEAIVQAAPDVPEAWLLLADALLAQGKLTESVPALQAAAKAHPNSINTHSALLMVLLNSNDFDAAEKEVATMRGIAPNHPGVLYGEAYLAFRANNLEEARTKALAVAQTAPGFLPGQLLAGTVLVRRSEFSLAQTYLTNVLDAIPSQPMARTLLVAALLGNGQVERARDTLQPLLSSKYQLNAEQMGLAGRVYMANGDLARAEEYFQRAAVAEPENARAQTQVAITHMMEGDADRAISELEKASRLDPDAIQPDLAKIAIHMRRHEIDLALEAFKAVERKQPNEPQTYNLKGGLLAAKGDKDGARTAYEKAVSLRPDFLVALINLAQFDLADEKPDQALKRFAALVAPGSKNVDAMLAYADLLRATGGKASDIQTVLERAVQAAPGQLAPNVALTRFYLIQNDLPKARALAQQTSTSWPNDPRALDMLAQTQIANKDYQLAIATLGKLVSLQPKSPVPLLMLAEVQQANGDMTAAEASNRKALAVKPDDPRAQRQIIVTLLAKKDFPGALKIARAMQSQPGNAVLGYSLEGDVQLASSKTAEAIKAFREAYKQGKQGEQFIRLHTVLNHNGQATEAGQLADEWLKAQPKDLIGRSYLAERALVDKRYPEAKRLYQELVALAPRNVLLLNNLAWAAFQSKDEQALALAEKANTLAPDNPAVLDTLGNIQIERGKGKEGLANIERAFKLASNQGALHLSLVKAYARLGRNDDARREAGVILTRAPEGSPLHTEVSALLKTLK